MSPETPAALQNLRVLDLSRILTGPYCTMMLADLGAEVIKVEAPGVGDDTRQWGPPFVNGESTYFLSINRNKSSITLNLKHPEGRKILLELVKDADVLVENFRPGTMAKLGFSFEQLAEINPRLIYCAISGFGLTGPYAHKAGFDILAQAMGGTMGVTGTPDGAPVKVGMSIADIGAGMFAAFGILAAVNARNHTGRGQIVDTSLFESQIAWHTYLATAYFASGKVPGKLGSAHPSIVPYQALKAADGYIVVGVGNDNMWQKFCQVSGLGAEVANDARFRTNADRVNHRAECLAVVEGALQQKTMVEWMPVLEEAGIPVGPIYNLAQVYDDPQAQARQMAVEVEHPTAGRLKLTGIPIKMSATPGQIKSPPPLLGEHTDAVLARLGYTAEQIAQLRESGAI